MNILSTWQSLAIAGSLLLLGCQGSPESQARQAYLKGTIQPGQGISDVRVGKTTLSELQARFGKPDKLETQEDNKLQCNKGKCKMVPTTKTSLSYTSDQLEFAFQGPIGEEPLLQWLSVSCQGTNCPFSGQTDKGIRFGSTRKQLLQAYGSSLQKTHNHWVVNYSTGIGFGFQEKNAQDALADDEDVVNSIQVLGLDHPQLK